MTTTVVQDPISPDLKQVLRRLKLGKMLDTLPERLGSLQARSGEAAAAVGTRYFRHTRAVEWSA